MDFHTLLENSEFILMEGSINERLRRMPEVKLHKTLVNAPLIYNKQTKHILADIYRQYIQIALEADLPMLITTPTWRASRPRVDSSEFDTDVNGDCVRFLQSVRDDYPQIPIMIAGLFGPANDCYKPEEALPADQAEEFHSWQIEKLATAGVDCFQAATIPHSGEAIGIARALAKTSIPYIISFVINKTGTLLNGESLDDAIAKIDSSVSTPPAGYMINCAYPSFLKPEELSPQTLARMIGFQANASSLSHDELDDADELKLDPTENWIKDIKSASKNAGLKILGGCCGTNCEHISGLV